MKHILEIECPEGYKPVFNPNTNTVEIVPEYSMESIKTFEDACKVLNIGESQLHEIKWLSDPHLKCVAKIDIIRKALNKGHNFSLTKGDVYYPWVRFYSKGKVPTLKEKDIIKDFECEGSRYTLVGGGADSGSGAGLGCFGSGYSVGGASATVGFLSCKDEATALHFSKYFGDLIFDMCYMHQLDYTWID